MEFNDPETNACMWKLHALGGECANTLLQAAEALGEHGGPAVWEQMLQISLRRIRERVETMMVGETDPNAPHAAEAMIQAIEEGFFARLREISFICMEPEGSA